MTAKLKLFQEPISKFQDKMYVSDAGKDGFQLVSQEAKKPIRVIIGERVKPPKRLDASFVPQMVRRAVYERAKQAGLIASSITEDTIDVASLIRYSATIKVYTVKGEQAYVQPKNCMFPSFL